MEIITPKTYVIKLEEKDDKVITDCLDLLGEIAETMTRLNCEILDTHYGDIKRYEIKDIIETLDTLRYAENVKGE